jgi:hypothetical protein
MEYVKKNALNQPVIGMGLTVQVLALKDVLALGTMDNGITLEAV